MKETRSSETASSAPQSGLRALVGSVFTGDRVLWIIIAALAVISVLVVYSSTAKMAYDAHTARSTAHFLRQQVGILILCVPIIVIVHKINCRVYNRLAQPVYVLSLLLTLAVYFIGATTNGAARWIPVAGFQFQPSEALKVATILLLARRLSSCQSKIDRIRIVPSLNPFRWGRPAQRKIWREGTRPILLPVVLSCAVIFPAHTSSAMLVFLTSLVMMLIGRVRVSELVRLVGLACAALLLAGLLNLGRSETAGGRVSTWIDLWTSSQTEKPIDRLTDTERSMIAIHNGGLLGEGAGQSAMRVEMIHPESDYAYAFFVEEYGIILAGILLMLYLWIFFRARERGALRGVKKIALLVIDEAQHLSDSAMASMLPTQNRAYNPQTIYMGTPPGPRDNGEAFTRLRDKTRAGRTHSTLYVEFAADRDADPLDREQWRKANPSYPAHTSDESIANLWENLTGDDFRREALGIWDEHALSRAIDRRQWEEATIDARRPGGVMSFGIDMPPDRSVLTIGAALRYADGSAIVQMANIKDARQAGTMWAVDWLAEHWPKTASVVIDAQSPAMSLLPELKKAHVKVTVTNMQEMGRACGRFLDMLKAGTLKHPRDEYQPQLAAAVKGATTRPLGQSGAIAWNKLGSDVDITPLVSTTLALYGAFTTKRHPGRRQEVMF